MGKIPDEATCVFKGAIFEVWQWEQKMYDGSVEIFEKIRRPNTVMSIAITGDKIMIARDEQPDRGPKYTLPGGRQEADETPQVGAERELLEETGYAPASMELFLEVQPTNKIDWTIYTYIARDCKKITEPALDPGEKVELNLVDFDEFIQIVLSEEFMETHLQLHILKMQGDYTEFRRLLGV